MYTVYMHYAASVELKPRVLLNVTLSILNTRLLQVIVESVATATPSTFSIQPVFIYKYINEI